MPLKDGSVVRAVCLPRVKAEKNGCSLDPFTADRNWVSAKCLQEALLVIQSRDVRLTQTERQLSMSDKILQLLQSVCLGSVERVKQVRKYTVTVNMPLLNVT